MNNVCAICGLDADISAMYPVGMDMYARAV